MPLEPLSETLIRAISDFVRFDFNPEKYEKKKCQPYPLQKQYPS